MERVLGHMSARESKTTQNPCALCKDPDGCPSAQGKSGTELQELFQPLGPTEGEGRRANSAAPNTCIELMQGYEETSLSS